MWNDGRRNVMHSALYYVTWLVCEPMRWPKKCGVISTLTWASGENFAKAAYERFNHLSIFLSIYLLSVFLSFFLFICYLSLCLSVWINVQATKFFVTCSFVCLSVCLPLTFFSSACLFLFLSDCLPPSNFLSVCLPPSNFLSFSLMPLYVCFPVFLNLFCPIFHSNSNVRNGHVVLLLLLLLVVVVV